MHNFIYKVGLFTIAITIVFSIWFIFDKLDAYFLEKKGVTLSSYFYSIFFILIAGCLFPIILWPLSSREFVRDNMIFLYPIGVVIASIIFRKYS
jgi:hypothetical protein